MAKITTDIYWQGPGYYALKETTDGDTKREEYRFLAPLSMSVEDVNKKAKALEAPPYYFTPRVRPWRTRPADNECTTVHDVTAE